MQQTQLHPPVASSSKHVIDLTGRTPSPPPRLSFADTPPNTPVCIGQLTVTALVLNPVDYLKIDENHPPPNPLSDEWAPVRLRCEDPDKRKKSGEETIYIHVPQLRLPDGRICGNENFGVVEQKVANTLGPMLSKALIKVDARIRRTMPVILQLEMLVFTPKGNIHIVSGFLQQAGLLLDHPAADNSARLGSILYSNPHNPPPGGFRNALARQSSATNRWSQAAPTGKSVEVQRSQVDELFKNIEGGEDLPETEPAPDVATKLYPHQKKALTFLLEREREITQPNGQHSSLWKRRRDRYGRETFYNIVTSRETVDPPTESKSALLADDMGLGKTISCVALVAATLRQAREFGKQALDQLPPLLSSATGGSFLQASHFAGSVWGMPDTAASSSSGLSAKEAKKMKAQDKRAEEEYTRANRLKTRSRATLIVCPLSTVSNWEEQFREHWRGEVTVVGGAGAVCPHAGSSAAPTAPPTPGPSCNAAALSTASLQAAIREARVRDGSPMRIYIYHGNTRRPDPLFLADFDVVLTTYSTLASEYSKQTRSTQLNDEDDAPSDDVSAMDVEDGSSKKKAKKRKPRIAPGQEATSPLQMVHWFRIVLDEAHSIKETNTVGCRASCDLMADRRICLTGTPVQNKLDDVFALLKFMRIQPFDDKVMWMEFIGSPVKYGQQLGVARLQTIMSVTTLRRTKESKNAQGQRILTLPPRRDELRYLKFDENEQAIYNGFFDESKAEFTQLSRTNQVMKNYVGILQKILRLRQICDHWQLVEDKPPAPECKDFVDTANGVDQIVDSMDHHLTLCSATVVFGLLRESGTASCGECGAELATALDSWERDAPEMDPQCIAPSGAKRGRKPKSSAPGTRASSPSAAGKDGAAPRPVMTKCRHLFCLACFRSATYPEWPQPPPPPPEGSEYEFTCSTCQTELALPSDAIEVSPEGGIPAQGVKKKVKKEKRQRGQVTLESYQASTKVRALLSDLMHFSRANPHSANYDPAAIEFEEVDSEGNRTDDGVVKTIVFSQWTSMLDKIEDALELANIQYDRLDGTMKRDDRQKAMDALKQNPACEVLLVSLRAGGVGLNLTAATRCYLMDPYWNPAVENQAVDRIHRLGQTRPVTTIKLIIENTIEARLLEVQKKKTEIANMTLAHTGGMTKAELMQHRLRELQTLFG
ncbi:hypothetical protein EXIGLDRAFT_612562 [Exidia glandulosa HHB12029]|uniref:P-loop containing nucleoside triphosphate hydrolase protein n=1 Tax=Exidia glandulosa HHB12029 TaxID=1314781 RepID=A0A165IS18_EXIGL|nr:hypothetical protein EXIGLDRAFT_612562 [Exidia glandulosa HHB12029]